MVSQGNRKLQLPNQFPDYFPWRQLMWWLILMSDGPDCLDWHEKTHRRRCGQLLQVAAQVKKVVTEDSSPAFVVSALPLAAEWTDPVVSVADFFTYIRTRASGFHHGLKNHSSPVWATETLNPVSGETSKLPASPVWGSHCDVIPTAEAPAPRTKQRGVDSQSSLVSHSGSR